MNVDDNAGGRYTKIHVLQPAGLEVLEAFHWQRCTSSLIVDGLHRAVGDGCQLADAACVDRPKLKVLFTTGYAEAAITGTINLETGMQTMVKPFALERFAHRINDMLDQ